VALTVVPATALAGKAMVVLTSVKLTLTVAVLSLLPGVGSVVPGGGLTLATLAKVPLAFRATLTWNVTVARAPLAKVVLPLMAVPAPLAVAVTPALVTMLVMVPRPAGRLSVQLAPATALGPLLPMTMV
jgi:hypothetical protein